MDSIYLGLDQSSNSHRLIIFYSRGALVNSAVDHVVDHLRTPTINEGQGTYNP